MTSPGGPIRVLLVDDHEHVLWGLGKLIDGEWPRMMVIGTAKSMLQAAGLMRERKPDVVLLDVYLGADYMLDRLPELLGIAPAEVLVLTDAADSELHERAVRGGARGVVRKEAPAEVLLQEIERIHLAHITPKVIG